VEHVVAVSSGKGGVGKSTVATNLAAAWADEGYRVGLLDADVYGPDIPTMFGVHERPRMEDDEVVPLEAHGVRLMSLGFIVDEDTPSIWRGPIIQGIVRQFLQQVRWGELDYLVVDLPPGTGDAQLSLAQLVRLDGGVFVTTPQDVAVGGVLKGVRMFERLEIPVSGIVENMRGFVCPDCGGRHEIFGSGGGEKLAASQGIPFLGAVPLGIAVREEGDRGLPTVLGRPDSPEAKALREVAATARERVVEMAAEREAADAAGAASAGPSGGTPGSDAR
jgi:ATP-binding protein involved in chromosome partitioning